MRVKQIFQIKLRGEVFELTPEDFAQLQKECREIAECGEDETVLTGFESYAHKAMQPPEDKPEPPVPEVVKTAKQPPPASAKKSRLEPYIKMHEAGSPIEAIKNQMLEDGFCPQTTLSYHIGNVLKASTRVTHIEAPTETDEECIERLKREKAAERQRHD